jgi:hypothetical protein
VEEARRWAAAFLLRRTRSLRRNAQRHCIALIEAHAYCTSWRFGGSNSSAAREGLRLTVTFWSKMRVLVEGFGSVGAGDWASAALIDSLGRAGLRRFRKTSGTQLLSGIQYAHVLASWNCKYEGARGGMYESSWQSLQNYIHSASLRIRPSVARSEQMNAVSTTIDLCRSCSPSSDTNSPLTSTPRVSIVRTQAKPKMKTIAL